MKGNDQVLDVLNEVLTGELTAINQYFLHAKICQNWGYERLYQHIYKESIDEMRHADQLVTRILFLDGLPNLQRLGRIHVGESVAEQFRVDLALEMTAMEVLRRGISLCLTVGDEGTRQLLTRILESEEEHIDWLETQQRLLEQLGVEPYLAEQLKA